MTPVLIVGAGLGGLSTAVFLGVHGIPSLVVERHAGLSGQPKARGQAPVTMEALAAAGLADRFAAANPPGRREMKISIADTLTGPIRRSFAESMPDLSAYSPHRGELVSQERAERILAERAVELGAEIRFSAEVESFEQDGEQVTARVRDLTTGQGSTTAASYLVAADGHRGRIRDALGIGVHGRRSAGTSSSLFAQFRAADLDGALDGAAFGLWHLQNPALPQGTATIVTTDQPGRYVLVGAFDAGDAQTDRLIGHIRTAAGLPHLQVDIVDVAWTTSAEYVTRVADRFRQGRVLLVGDAAHLVPPTGGQGGNAAVMDGYHLAWKLAAVVTGKADDALLNSHDAERRPYADLLAEQQYAHLVQRTSPQLRDDTVAVLVDPARGLFGYACPAGAFVAEPGEGPLFEDPAQPSGRPGTRAPHVVLPDGSSTVDLFGRGFVVFTDSDITEEGVDTRPIPGKGFLAAYRIAETGAVLVRPDGIIAWRSDHPAGLSAALRSILR